MKAPRAASAGVSVTCVVSYDVARSLLKWVASLSSSSAALTNEVMVQACGAAQGLPGAAPIMTSTGGIGEFWHDDLRAVV